MTALPTATRSSGPVDMRTALQSQLGRGAPGLLHESADQVRVLATAVGRGVGPGERIDPRRPHVPNRFGDIVRTQATGQDDWNVDADRCHDAGTDVPVVNATRGADARDIRIVRVEKKVVTDRSETLGGIKCLVGRLRPSDLDRLHQSRATRKDRTQPALLLDT